MERPISAVSASSLRQNTVFRIMIGGSAGFSTMIALPRRAPPTISRAREVVCVNSSMLARVPGPADLLAIEETISAYGTGATRLTAATIGLVACPPQLTMLTCGECHLAP